MFNKFKKAIQKATDQTSRFLRYLKRDDPLLILPYRGYANRERFFLKGRVLENENIFSDEIDGKLRNIINSFRRFETDEVPGSRVRIHCFDQSFERLTGAEGFFNVDQNWTGPELSSAPQWLSTSVELLYSPKPKHEKITSKGEIFYPSKQAEFGVITDIDDTILHTHVASFLRLKMLYMTLFKNAYQRMPLEGMPELMQKWAQGKLGMGQNPIFYLSHSPWNLYDLLVDFLDHNAFPKGPVLLRDYGIQPSGHFKDHKLNTIAHIMETYPELPFILIGDSAEKDADFYLEAAAHFPNSIQSIYIRETRNRKNARRIKALLDSSTGVDAHLVKNAQAILDREKVKGNIVDG